MSILKLFPGSLIVVALTGSSLLFADVTTDVCFANQGGKGESAPSPTKPVQSPLVLEFGVNGLQQEIVVAEGREFRVVTRVGQSRWIVSGSVGRIIDGIVAVDLTFDSGDLSPGKASVRYQLELNQYPGGSQGTHTLVIHRLWIRRGLDPVPVLTQALAKQDAGFHAVARYLSKLGPTAKSAVPELVGILKSENESLSGERRAAVRQIAAETLGRIGPNAQSAVAALAEAGDDKNGHVRVASSLALWRIEKHPGAVSTLIAALEHESTHVRVDAIDALQSIGVEAPQAAPALKKLLDHQTPRLRINAATALWSISRDEDAIDSLLNSLQEDDEQMRASAAGALGEIHADAKTAIPALVHSVLNDTPRVQEWAAVSSRKLDPTASLTIRAFAHAAESEEQRLRAIKTLSGLGQCAIPNLVKALEDEDENVRRIAIGPLYSFGAAAVDPLVKLLSHADSNVRLMGALTLKDIGSEASSAIPVLVKALSDDDERVRTALSAALTNIGSPAVPAVTETLHAEMAEARVSAATILGEIGRDARTALPRLKERLQDSSADVRTAAEKAITRIRIIQE